MRALPATWNDPARESLEPSLLAVVSCYAEAGTGIGSASRPRGSAIPFFRTARSIVYSAVFYPSGPDGGSPTAADASRAASAQPLPPPPPPVVIDIIATADDVRTYAEALPPGPERALMERQDAPLTSVAACLLDRLGVYELPPDEQAAIAASSGGDLASLVPAGGNGNGDYHAPQRRLSLTLAVAPGGRRASRTSIVAQQQLLMDAAQAPPTPVGSRLPPSGPHSRPFSGNNRRSSSDREKGSASGAATPKGGRAPSSSRQKRPTSGSIAARLSAARVKSQRLPSRPSE